MDINQNENETVQHELSFSSEKFSVQFLKPDFNEYNQVQLIRKSTNSHGKTTFSTVKICFVEKNYYDLPFLCGHLMSIEDGMTLLSQMCDAKFFKTQKESVRNKYSIDSFLEYCARLL